MSGSFDDGSFDAGYQEELLCTWRIQPTPPLKTQTIHAITISFSVFDLRFQQDYVRLYVNQGELLTAFTGPFLPDSTTVFASEILVEFVTAPNGNARGFVLDYSSSVECPSGYYLNNSGICTACSQGFYSLGGLPQNCTICPAGYYSSTKAGNTTYKVVGE